MKDLHNLLHLFKYFPLLFLLSACQNQELIEQNAQLKVENDSLKRVLTQTELITDALFNLSDSVQSMQDSVTLLSQQGALDKEALLGRVEAIKAYIRESDRQLARYQLQVVQSEGQNKKLLVLVRRYKEQIRAQEEKVALLQERIQNLEVENENLAGEVTKVREELSATSDTLTQQRQELVKKRQENLRKDSIIANKALEAAKVRAALLKKEAEALEEKADKINTLGILKKKKEEKKALYMQAIEKYREIIRLGDFSTLYHPQTRIFEIEEKIQKLGI